MRRAVIIGLPMNWTSQINDIRRCRFPSLMPALYLLPGKIRQLRWRLGVEINDNNFTKRGVRLEYYGGKDLQKRKVLSLE